MDQPLFFDLRSTHNPHRWYMPLTPAVCVGPPLACSSTWWISHH